MQQVVVIHGGDAFSTYDEYLTYLKAEKIDFEHLGTRGWKSGLGEALGEEYKIIAPSMPNKQNAKYVEWEIWFEKFFPLIRDDAVLIGHSLGGCFLAKYLGEKKFPKKIKALFLVAAPYDKDGKRGLVQFVPPADPSLLQQQVSQVFLYHSKDDPIVNFSELAKYQKALPSAQVRVFEDRQHFNQLEFPEIVEDIKSLAV